MHVQPRFILPGPTGATPPGSLLWPLDSRPSDGQRYPPVDSVPYLHPEKGFGNARNRIEPCGAVPQLSSPTSAQLCPTAAEYGSRYPCDDVTNG